MLFILKLNSLKRIYLHQWIPTFNTEMPLHKNAPYFRKIESKEDMSFD